MKLKIVINGDCILIDGVENNGNAEKGCASVHGIKSKVKTTASVDVEKLNSINEMVENFVTENRLKQGLDYLQEQHLDAEPKNLGPYIKWVIGDIAKEEMDVFEASGIEFKEFAKSATTKIRQWFLSNLK